ncbi:MAG: hypothetical protein ABH824_00480 [Nanoarchaeota archaeon]|nr:hypothetical protein [Nanoarchaeota archaeon]MBU1632677.1 hypothetical protein [Nanoarchaeota archaeon]MBU1876295.1 hypothetical protein [Nanoarchaeota archaeon]
MIRKIFSLSIFILLIALILGCKTPINPEDVTAVQEEIKQPIEEVIIEEQPEDVEEIKEPKVEEAIPCTKNSECTEGLLCINSKCGKISDLYKTDCTDTCKITEVELITSDKETYTLSLGQGSYSYAGALEWKLMTTPNYCKGEKPLVPIKFIKKSMGKVLEEQIFTLNEGQTSGIITHPSIKSVKFTAKLVKATENCS